MSWQQYIDSSLVGSGHIDKAAIISAAGDSVWAASSDLQKEMETGSRTDGHLKPGEIKTIANIYNDESAAATAQAEGIHLGGERYVVARIIDRTIYARAGKVGICIAKTKQAIIIAHHGENHHAQNASSTTEALADYLIKAGY
ncbi:Profilin/allergen [Xylariaceae sp. FL0594]|nr:Profilin/allergen [Xylariaceae sp. FL0594]